MASNDPKVHPLIEAALARREARRHRFAGLTAGVALIAVAMSLTLCSSCQSVPTETFKPVTNGGGDAGTFEGLLAEARTLYDKQPRNAENLRASCGKFAEAMKIKSDDYEALWQGARSHCWLAQHLHKPDERLAFAKDGLKYTATAAKLRPDGVEALLFHAILSGLLAQDDNSFGMSAVGIIEKNCKRIIELGVDLEHGGAHRVYGALLSDPKNPGPPASNGSLRNGRKQIELALEKAPDWPENHYYMARCEFRWAKEKNKPADVDSARARLEKYLLGPDAKAPADMQFEFSVWQADARKLLDEYTR